MTWTPEEEARIRGVLARSSDRVRVKRQEERIVDAYTSMVLDVAPIVLSTPDDRLPTDAKKLVISEIMKIAKDGDSK